jgi:hypothetical protein
MFRAHRPILRRIHTAVHITTGSWHYNYMVTFIVISGTNGCVNSCVNSPEDGPVGPKHVEIRRYKNKIKIVTSVGFSFHNFCDCLANRLRTELKVKQSLYRPGQALMVVPGV